MPVVTHGVWTRVRWLLPKPSVLLLGIGDAFRRWRKERDDPYAPFAMVGAPVRPRPPLRSSAIALEEPEF
jgi:hypothetical protein